MLLKSLCEHYFKHLSAKACIDPSPDVIKRRDDINNLRSSLVNVMAYMKSHTYDSNFTSNQPAAKRSILITHDRVAQSAWHTVMQQYVTVEMAVNHADKSMAEQSQFTNIMMGEYVGVAMGAIPPEIAQKHDAGFIIRHMGRSAIAYVANTLCITHDTRAAKHHDVQDASNPREVGVAIANYLLAWEQSEFASIDIQFEFWCGFLQTPPGQALFPNINAEYLAGLKQVIADIAQYVKTLRHDENAIEIIHNFLENKSHDPDKFKAFTQQAYEWQVSKGVSLPYKSIESILNSVIRKDVEQLPEFAQRHSMLCGAMRRTTYEMSKVTELLRASKPSRNLNDIKQMFMKIKEMFPYMEPKQQLRYFRDMTMYHGGESDTMTMLLMPNTFIPQKGATPKVVISGMAKDVKHVIAEQVFDLSAYDTQARKEEAVLSVLKYHFESFIRPMYIDADRRMVVKDCIHFQQGYAATNDKMPKVTPTHTARKQRK